jgi:S-adenosylmethionine uptake transporter
LGLPFAASLPANAAQWAGALTAGVLAVGSLILMSMAYRKVEAQRLFAVEYTAFIWAAILGWLIFEESVSTQTLLGTALIILGCVVTARSQVR